MRILQLSSLYPPQTKGGAELSAFYLGQWLARNGHTVGVITTAAADEGELHGSEENGILTWRIKAARSYPVHEHDRASFLRKVQWHTLDHLDPRNVVRIQSAINAFRPDAIVAHLLPGIGHNAVSPRGHLQNIPLIYMLHDLGLACVRSSMYRAGKNCPSKCATCRVSSAIKMRHLNNPERVCFVSPSADNLQTLRRHVNLNRHDAYVIPNLDLDAPIPRAGTKPDGRLRVGYVGRLHATKGVPFLLSILDRVSKDTGVLATVVGSGPLEAELRRKYSGKPWVHFLGRVPPSQVKYALAQMDVLCAPSIWRENHPGVVRQALRAGVPVLVSDIGGAPEMVEHQRSGMVLPVGNSEAWEQSILQLASDLPTLTVLQAGATKAGNMYSCDTLGRQFVETLIRAIKRARSARRPRQDLGVTGLR